MNVLHFPNLDSLVMVFGKIPENRVSFPTVVRFKRCYDESGFLANLRAPRALSAIRSKGSGFSSRAYVSTEFLMLPIVRSTNPVAL